MVTSLTAIRNCYMNKHSTLRLTDVSENPVVSYTWSRPFPSSRPRPARRPSDFVIHLACPCCERGFFAPASLTGARCPHCTQTLLPLGEWDLTTEATPAAAHRRRVAVLAHGLSVRPNALREEVRP